MIASRAYPQHVCVASNPNTFQSRYDKLFKALEKNKGGREFLTRNFLRSISGHVLTTKEVSDTET